MVHCVQGNFPQLTRA